MNTIIDLFEYSVGRFAGNPFLSEKQGGGYQSMTYQETKDYVKEIAGGLLAEGIKKGERVALLSEGRNDWICSELGILYAGGISVPLSMKLTLSELLFRINHSEARFMIVSEYFYGVIKAIVGELHGLEKIIVFAAQNIEDEKVVLFGDLLKRGRSWVSQHAEICAEICRGILPEDTACISYTSGTMAEPKGIMLTHGNFVCNVLQADSLIRIPEYYKILLFLPLDHSFAHTVGIFSFMYNGASVGFVDFGSSPKDFLRNIPVNMKELKPHVLLSVPAVAKNFRKNIEAGIKQRGRIAKCFYHWGIKTGYRYYGLGKNGKQPWYRFLFYPWVKIYDAFVFSKIRREFGGNLCFFVGGGALLDVELQRYFCTLGIPMYQGYGLSEMSPVISSNTPQFHLFGSSGKIVQPIELKICDEDGKELAVGEKGEIVVRGGNRMKAYWRNPDATEEVIRDGWFYTGDMGYLTKEGFLYVLGRFKSLLIADDGEKFSPEGIEEAIVEKSEYIDYCVLYNNQSPYTSALIVPNRTACKEYVESKGEEPGSIEGYKMMLVQLNEELMYYRKGGKYEGEFPERWLPAVVAVLPEPLSEHNGTINSTTKIVRHRITELFQRELNFVYTPEGKDITNVMNTENIKKLFEDWKL